MASPLSFSSRRAGCRYTHSNDNITLYVNDNDIHELSLYMVDYDTYQGGRDQNIEILDMYDNVLVGAINVTDFNDGIWLRYSFSGSIKIRLTNNHPTANAVISAIMFDSPSLAEGRTYSASSDASDANNDYSPMRAFDNDKLTRWSSAGNEYDDGWLEVDFGEMVSFNHVVIKRHYGISQSKSFKIQYYDGSQWNDAFIGGYIGRTRICVFNPVTGNKMRILFTGETTGVPSIVEVKVFNSRFY